MKKMWLNATVLFGCVALCIHFFSYYYTVNHLNQAPSKFLLQEDGTLAISSSVGDKVFVSFTNSQGKILKSVQRSRNTLFGKEFYQEVDMAECQGDLYILWNVYSAEDGAQTGQKIEKIIYSPFQKRNFVYVSPADTTSSITALSTYRIDEKESGLALGLMDANGQLAEFVYMDKSFQELGRESYNISQVNGPYRLQMTLEERFLLTYSGQLLHLPPLIEPDEIPEITDSSIIYPAEGQTGIVRDVFAKDGQTVGFLDIQSSAVHTYDFVEKRLQAGFLHDSNTFAVAADGKGGQVEKSYLFPAGAYTYIYSGDGTTTTIDRFQSNLLQALGAICVEDIFFAVILWVLLMLWLTLLGLLTPKEYLLKILTKNSILVINLVGVFLLCTLTYVIYDVQKEHLQSLANGNAHVVQSRINWDLIADLEKDRSLLANQQSYLQEVLKHTKQDSKISQNRLIVLSRERMFVVSPQDNMIFESIKDVYSGATVQKIYEAVQSGISNDLVLEDGFGVKLSCLAPAGSNAFAKFYIESGYPRWYAQNETALLMRNICLIACGVLFLLCLLVTILQRNTMAPLFQLKRELEGWVQGEKTPLSSMRRPDEINSVIRMMNHMSNAFSSQLYQAERIGQSYAKYVPLSIPPLFAKNHIAELMAGTGTEKTLCVLRCISAPCEGEGTEQVYLNNKYLSGIFTVLDAHSALHVQVDEHVTEVQACFDCTAEELCAIGKELSILQAQNRHYHQKSASILLSQELVQISLYGSEKHLVLLTDYQDATTAKHIQQYFMSHDSADVLITEAVMKQVNRQYDEYRYIGYVEENGQKVLLYDCFGMGDKELAALKKQTLPLFNDALLHFHQGKYYPAKRKFAQIVESNPLDIVAKKYLFRCIEKGALAEDIAGDTLALPVPTETEKQLV